MVWGPATPYKFVLAGSDNAFLIINRPNQSTPSSCLSSLEAAAKSLLSGLTRKNKAKAKAKPAAAEKQQPNTAAA